MPMIYKIYNRRKNFNNEAPDAYFGINMRASSSPTTKVDIHSTETKMIIKAKVKNIVVI